MGPAAGHELSFRCVALLYCWIRYAATCKRFLPFKVYLFRVQSSACPGLFPFYFMVQGYNAFALFGNIIGIAQVQQPYNNILFLQAKICF